MKIRTNNLVNLDANSNCPECDGEGVVEVWAGCTRPPSECCGGCFAEAPCPKCYPTITHDIATALPLVERVRQRIDAGALVLLTDEELYALADHEATSHEVWELLRDVDHYFPDMGGVVRGDHR